MGLNVFNGEEFSLSWATLNVLQVVGFAFQSWLGPREEATEAQRFLLCKAFQVQ